MFFQRKWILSSISFNYKLSPIYTHRHIPIYSLYTCTSWALEIKQWDESGGKRLIYRTEREKKKKKKYEMVMCKSNDSSENTSLKFICESFCVHLMVIFTSCAYDWTVERTKHISHPMQSKKGRKNTQWNKKYKTEKSNFCDWVHLEKWTFHNLTLNLN